MSFYKGFKVTVKAPVSGKFDEKIVRAAFDNGMPGIEVEFCRTLPGELLEVESVFEPTNKAMEFQEQDPKTGKWKPVNIPTALVAATDIVNTINMAEG